MLLMRQLLITILSLLWALVLLLVGARLVALLLNANQESGLVQQLYRLSEFLVEPFFGVLNLSNSPVPQTGGTFEPASLIGLIVYLVLGSVVIGIVRGAFPPFGERRTAITR